MDNSDLLLTDEINRLIAQYPRYMDILSDKGVEE